MLSHLSKRLLFFLAALVISTIAIAILTILTIDTFYVAAIIGFIQFILALIPLGIGSILFIVGFGRKSGKLNSAAAIVMTALVFNIIIFFAWFLISNNFTVKRTENAVTYCNKLIFEIEEYSHLKKHYPLSLNEIIHPGVKVPGRLENYPFYRSNGKEYLMIVPLVGPNGAGLVYSSRSDKREELFLYDLPLQP